MFQSENPVSLTGLMSLCTILSECKYSRPQAACASYMEDGVSSWSFVINYMVVAYQLQSIGPPVFLDVFDDISVL